jgi:branched-chain amino acid transport system substrate-binding protein
MGGAKIELVFYDNESNPDRSRIVAERLVAEHPDIAAVTGAAASAFVIPMLPTFERAGITFITAQTSGLITSQGYKHVFAYAAQSPGFADAQVGILQWINETYNVGLSKIGLVYEDTEWGLTNAQAARDLIAKIPGFELVYDMSFAPGAADLSPLVLGLMQANAEVLFPTVYTHDARLLISNMQAFNYEPIIVGGGGGIVYPAFAKELGDLVNGVLSVGSHNFDAKTIMNNPELASVGKDFEARFGYFMPEQACGTYSAIYLLAAALEKAGTVDRDTFSETFRSLDVAALTPGGAMKFDETGWNVNSVGIMSQWQKDPDGVYRTRSVYPPSEATVEFQLTKLLTDRIDATKK